MSQLGLFGASPPPAATQVDQPAQDAGRPLPPGRRARREEPEIARPILASDPPASSIQTAAPSPDADSDIGEASDGGADLVTFEEAIRMLRRAREQAQRRQQLLEHTRARFPPGTDPMPVEAFFAEHGRLPHIGDETPPWHYLGWLRPYVQRLHHYGGLEAKLLPDRSTWTPAPGKTPPPVLGFPDRWGYYLRTLEAGRLLPEPIPRVEFVHADQSVLREMESWLRVLEHDGQGWSAISSLVDFLGFGLATSRNRPKISDKAAEQLYRQIKIERWLQRPSDYLGQLIMDRFGGGPNAFFSTPHAVVEMMSRMLFETVDKPLSCDEHDPRRQSVNEPCLGSGRMLLHASNYSLVMFGMDKDPFVLEAAKINFAVYAPWALYGLPWEPMQYADEEKDAKHIAWCNEGLKMLRDADIADGLISPEEGDA